MGYFILQSGSSPIKEKSRFLNGWLDLKQIIFFAILRVKEILCPVYQGHRRAVSAADWVSIHAIKDKIIYLSKGLQEEWKNKSAALEMQFPFLSPSAASGLCTAIAWPCGLQLTEAPWILEPPSVWETQALPWALQENGDPALPTCITLPILSSHLHKQNCFCSENTCRAFL